MTSYKIAKTADCTIVRRTVDRASVEFTPDGTVYSYDVYDNKDTIEMEIMEINEQEPGVDLVDDIDEGIKAANRMIDKYGKDSVELLINSEEDELYVHFHSKHDSFCIYDFKEYNIHDKFIVECIKEAFEEADIDICEY